MKVMRASSFWRDLKGIIDYFDNVKEESAALRFIDALDGTIDSIGEHPDLGSPWESSRPRREALRFRLVKGFENHLVVYCRRDQHVYLLRVLHGSQNLDGV